MRLTIEIEVEDSTNVKELTKDIQHFVDHGFKCAEPGECNEPEGVRHTIDQVDYCRKCGTVTCWCGNCVCRTCICPGHRYNKEKS